MKAWSGLAFKQINQVRAFREARIEKPDLLKVGLSCIVDGRLTLARDVNGHWKVVINAGKITF